MRFSLLAVSLAATLANSGAIPHPPDSVACHKTPGSASKGYIERENLQLLCRVEVVNREDDADNENQRVVRASNQLWYGTSHHCYIAASDVPTIDETSITRKCKHGGNAKRDDKKKCKDGKGITIEQAASKPEKDKPAKDTPKKHPKLKGSKSHPLDKSQSNNAWKIMDQVKKEFKKKDRLRYCTAALATAYVESTMINKKGGHGSSVGLFQQVSSHGTVKQRRNVAWATHKFFEMMRAVPNYKNLSIGELCWRTQQPARQYRDRYGKMVKWAKNVCEQGGF